MNEYHIKIKREHLQFPRRIFVACDMTGPNAVSSSK